MSEPSFTSLNAVLGMSRIPVRPAMVGSQSSRVEKLEWYADTLVLQAASKEKSGKIQEAIADYLKAVDILMLLARDQENYTIWKRYSDKATACQQKVRSLIT